MEPLGKIEWDEETKVGIVSLFAQQLGLTTDKLRTTTLIEMGSLVTVLKTSAGSSVPDVSNMNMTIPASFDVLSILGSKITDPVMVREYL
jgi:hypothetical protein